MNFAPAGGCVRESEKKIKAQEREKETCKKSSATEVKSI